MKKIDRDDYTHVAAWLRKQKVDEQDDEKSADVLADKGFSMPDDKAPDVAWAHGGPLRFKDDVMQVFRNDRWQSVLKKVKTTRPTDKKLRQFKFDLKDVKLAQDHLKEHGSLKKGDLDIPWVSSGHTFKTNSQLNLPPGPRNRTLLMTQESKNGPWLQIVAQEMIGDWLRTEMLKANSEMPLTRDAGYHWLKGKTLGISRRALWQFLEKQEHLQMTRNIPNERKKGNIGNAVIGHVEIDIVHIQKQQLTDEEKNQMIDSFDDPNAMVQEDAKKTDGYFLTMIDRVTRYGLAVVQRRKNATETAVSLRKMLTDMRRATGQTVIKVFSDQGKEFMGPVKALFTERNVKHKTVERGAHIENYNQNLQRNFYRCLHMSRGSVRSCLKQAVILCNGTFNKNLGMTPAEAVSLNPATVQARYKESHAATGDMQYLKTKKPKIGDKCRVLVNLRKLIRKVQKGKGMYKASKGIHFSRRVFLIKHVDEKKNRFYVAGAWKDRDEIMLISGVDATTKGLLKERRTDLD